MDDSIVTELLPGSPSIQARSATLGVISQYFGVDPQLSAATTLVRSGTKVSPTNVQLHRFHGSGVIASSDGSMGLLQ
jgi:hypothetical protein